MSHVPFARALAFASALAFAGAPASAEVEWFDGSLGGAVAEARNHDRLVLIALTGSGEMSQRLREETFAHDVVGEILAEVVPLHVDAESSLGETIVSKYNVRTVPALLYVRGDTRAEEVIFGYIPGDALVYETERVLRGESTVSSFREAVERHPDDLGARLALSEKLGWVGDEYGQQDELAVIRERDPEGESEAGAKVGMWDRMWELLDHEGEQGHADFSMLTDYLDALPHHGVRFDGYNWVAQSLHARGDESGAWNARMAAWEVAHPGDQAREYGNELAWGLFEAREQLDDDARAFALQVADATVGYAREAAVAMAEPCEGCDSCDEDAEACTPPDGSKIDRWLATYVDTLAACKLMNGDADGALALARECVQLDPERGDYAERVAQAERAL